MSKSIYIASALENYLIVRRLQERFQANGVQLSYDWTRQNKDGLPLETTPERLRTAGIAELSGVIKADAILMIMPANRGSHFEVGCGYMLRKPIVILDADTTHRPVALHYLDNIVRCATEDEAFIAVLSYLEHRLTVVPDLLDRLLNHD